MLLVSCEGMMAKLNHDVNDFWGNSRLWCGGGTDEQARMAREWGQKFAKSMRGALRERTSAMVHAFLADVEASDGQWQAAQARRPWPFFRFCYR